jgi:hypothetical protein
MALPVNPVFMPMPCETSYTDTNKNLCAQNLCVREGNKENEKMLLIHVWIFFGFVNPGKIKIPDKIETCFKKLQLARLCPWPTSRTVWLAKGIVY